MDLLLQALQKELLSEPAPLGMLPVALPPLDLLRLGQLRLPAGSDSVRFQSLGIGRRGGSSRRTCRGNAPGGGVHGLRRRRHLLRLALGRRCRLADGKAGISGTAAGHRKVAEVAVAEELVEIESVLLAVGIVLEMVVNGREREHICEQMWYI